MVMHDEVNGSISQLSTNEIQTERESCKEKEKKEERVGKGERKRRVTERERWRQR